MAAAAAAVVPDHLREVVLGAKNEFDKLLDKIIEVTEEVKGNEVFEEALKGFSSACFAGNESMGDDFKEALEDIQTYTKALVTINGLFLRTKKIRTSVVQKIIKGDIKAEDYAEEGREMTPKELGREIAKRRVESKWRTLQEEVEKLPITLVMEETASSAKVAHARRKEHAEAESDDEAELNRKRRKNEDEDEEA